MNWIKILSVTLIILFMVLYEWPKMNSNQTKEKAAFSVLLVMGWLLAALLIYFPEIQGPTQWMDALFKPFGKVMEN